MNSWIKAMLYLMPQELIGLVRLFPKSATGTTARLYLYLRRRFVFSKETPHAKHVLTDVFNGGFLMLVVNCRYQLLHVLSKEVINRLQGFVDDHKSYEEKLIDTENWIAPLEVELKELKKDGDVVQKGARLQALLGSREQGAHRITTLTVMAEKLYPDTAAHGRDKVRTALRELRDRYIHFQFHFRLLMIL